MACQIVNNLLDFGSGEILFREKKKFSFLTSREFFFSPASFSSFSIIWALPHVLTVCIPVLEIENITDDVSWKIHSKAFVFVNCYKIDVMYFNVTKNRIIIDCFTWQGYDNKPNQKDDIFGVLSIGLTTKKKKERKLLFCYFSKGGTRVSFSGGKQKPESP